MNKKKKLNILLSFIAIIILVGFNGIMVVLSWDNNFGGKPGSINVSGCGGGNCSWNMRFGARVSLVDKDGKHIGGKIADFWNKSAITSNTHKNYTMYNDDDSVIVNYTKLQNAICHGESIRQEATVATEGTLTCTGGYWNQSFVHHMDHFGSDAPELDKLYNQKTATNSGDKGTPMKFLEALYDDLENSPNKEQLATKLLSLLGYNGKIEDAAAEEIYIQIEPMIALGRIGTKINQYYFAGTLTEFFINDAHYSGGSGSVAQGYGTLIHIVSGKKRPTIFSVDGQDGFDLSRIKNINTGDAVGHIFTGDLVDSGDCFTLLKMVNDESNPTYWSGGTQTAEYHKAVEAIRNGNTSYIIKDKNGNQYKSSGLVYDDPKEHYWLIQDHYILREKMKKKASCYAPTIECGTDTGEVNTSSGAIRFLHYWSGISVNTPEYDEAISKFRDGTYFYYATGYTKDEDGNFTDTYDYFLLDKAYTDDGLKKENYGSGKAKCGTINNECASAVAYIKQKYFGTTEYDAKIGQVKNGTFNEADYSISEPQNFSGLVKSIYDNYNGGIAVCDNIVPPSPCGQPADVYIDTCVTGNSWTKDSANETMWLKCETAFKEDGTSYASENTGHLATEDSITKNKIVGNRDYCQVFCYEEVETEFPTAVSNVKAGQTFFWGNGTREDGVFGTVKIKKVCKTQEQTDGGKSGDGYLYKKWEKDYVTNERNRTSNWIKKGAVEQLIERCSPPYNCVSVYSYCPVPLVPYSCGTAEHPSTCYYCPVAYKYGYSPSASQGHSQVTEWKLPEYGSATIYNSYSPTSSGSGYLTADAARQAGHAAVMSELYAKQGELIGNDTGFKRREEELIEKIRQCANKMQYVYETTVDFVFQEPENPAYGAVNRKYYAQEKYDDLLLMEPANAEDGITTNTRGGKNCHKEEIWLYKCIGTKLDSKCVHESSIWVDYCDQLDWNIEGSWTYKYKQEDFIWFSLKYNENHPDETLMNQQERDEKYSTVDENLFYSIGFGLPTALSLPNGSYGTNVNSPMKVIVSKLGDTGGDQDYDIDPSYAGQKNYHKVDGHFQNLLDAVTVQGESTYGLEYICTYEVINDMFGTECEYDEAGNLTPDSPHYCDDLEDDRPSGRVLGIDVAYRLVSLLQDTDDISKAFPGRNGEGRLQGSNWQLATEDVKDILKSDIYEDEAMYEIFLDSGLITKIRDDNKNFVGGDSYTSFENIICVGGNDKYCASEFVSKLAVNGFSANYPMVGTCVGETNTQARAEAHGACDNNWIPLDVKWAR